MFNGINNTARLRGTPAASPPQQRFGSPNSFFNSANGINDSGQIVGFYDSGGIFTTLDDPNPSSQCTYSSGINNKSQIVGYRQTGPTPGSASFIRRQLLYDPRPERQFYYSGLRDRQQRADRWKLHRCHHGLSWLPHYICGRGGFGTPYSVRSGCMSHRPFRDSMPSEIADRAELR
jgi:hypothetical protein